MGSTGLAGSRIFLDGAQILLLALLPEVTQGLRKECQSSPDMTENSVFTKTLLQLFSKNSKPVFSPT